MEAEPLRLLAAGLTGPSMNPGVSFGLAVVYSPIVEGGCWKQHWVFWCGPFVGSSAAAILATAIFLGNPRAIKSVLLFSRGRQQFDRMMLPDSTDADHYNVSILADSKATLLEIRNRSSQ